jgi:hypothetical protein
VYTGRFVRQFRGKAVRYTDQRVKLMSEILIAIKLVKFYAWEAPFAKRVSEARAVEVRQVQKGKKGKKRKKEKKGKERKAKERKKEKERN